MNQSIAIRVSTREREGVALYLVTLFGEEFQIRGNTQMFASLEEAEQFTLELCAEFGADANIEIKGLDHDGLPATDEEADDDRAGRAFALEREQAFNLLRPRRLSSQGDLYLFSLEKAVRAMHWSAQQKCDMAFELLPRLGVMPRGVWALKKLPVQVLAARLRCIFNLPSQRP